MVRVKRQTYANYANIDIDDYREVHGLIEEFGGKVKQFTQDVNNPVDWYIFYEMAKLQENEFEEALDKYLSS